MAFLPKSYGEWIRTLAVSLIIGTTLSLLAGIHASSGSALQRVFMNVNSAAERRTAQRAIPTR